MITVGIGGFLLALGYALGYAHRAGKLEERS